jgi:rare lipoprotein A (peptidoglycan hydrolase)
MVPTFVRGGVRQHRAARLSRIVCASVTFLLLGLVLAGCSTISSESMRMTRVDAAAPPSWAATLVPARQLDLSLAAVPSPRPAVRPAVQPVARSTGNLAQERQNAVAKIGKPYLVNGQWYVPQHDPDYEGTGIASWYGPDFHGKRTANGEVYNMRRLTAAHPTLPLPCYISVTNLANGRTVVVRVNDRGPYKRGRIVDVSQRAAELLDFTRTGTAQVRVKYVGKAPIGPDDRFEQQFLAKQGWFRLQSGQASLITGATRPLPGVKWDAQVSGTP